MKKVTLALFSSLFVFTLAACGSSNNDSNEKEASSESSVTKESTKETTKSESNSDFVATAADSTFDGSTLKGNSYSIKITNHKVIQPGESGNEYGDKPVIAFWYDTLVSPDYSDDIAINPTTAWITNFTAVQDNDPNKVNKLNIASLPDQQYLDSQTAEIKPGGTVPNAVAYQLTDNETPVVLTAGNITGKEYGKAEFAIK